MPLLYDFSHNFSIILTLAKVASEVEEKTQFLTQLLLYLNYEV